VRGSPIVAVGCFTYSLARRSIAGLYATGDYAYHRFATGDNFALFFESCSAIPAASSRSPFALVPAQAPDARVGVPHPDQWAR